MTSRWSILTAAAGAQGAGAAIFQGLPSVGPQLGDEYRLGLAQLGLALSAVTFGMTLSLMPWGMLADRVGERRVIASGLCLASVALGIAALAPTFPVLLGSLLLTGAACASANAATGRTIMGWFGSGERGMAMSIRHASLPIGAAMAAVVLPLLAATGGIRSALWGLAVGSLGGALAAALILRDPPSPSRATGRERTLHEVVASPRIWRLSSASSLLVVGQFLFVGLLVVYLHSEHGFSAAQAAAAFATLQLVSAGSRVLSGRWSDRRRDRVGTLRLLALAAAGTLLAAILARGLPEGVELTAVAVAAIATSSWNGVASVAVAETAGQARSGTALGLYNTVVALTSALAVAGLAALASTAGWSAAFLAAALCGFLAAAVMPTARDAQGLRPVLRYD